jgi:hypothetical protein
MIPLKISKTQNLYLKLLESIQAKFLVIGGFAVKVYCPDRNTNDLDILLFRLDPALEKLALFFEKYNPLNDRSWKDVFLSENKRIPYPNESLTEVDFLTSIDGVDFQTFYANSAEVMAGDFIVRIPSLEDLITMKIISRNSGNCYESHIQDESDIQCLTNLLRLKQISGST